MFHVSVVHVNKDYFIFKQIYIFTKSDSQEWRLLETFVTHETKTTNLNLDQGKENRHAQIKPAPIIHNNISSVDVHYQYY